MAGVRPAARARAASRAQTYVLPTPSSVPVTNTSSSVSATAVACQTLRSAARPRRSRRRRTPSAPRTSRQPSSAMPAAVPCTLVAAREPQLAPRCPRARRAAARARRSAGGPCVVEGCSRAAAAPRAAPSSAAGAVGADPVSSSSEVGMRRSAGGRSPSPSGEVHADAEQHAAVRARARPARRRACAHRTRCRSASSGRRRRRTLRAHSTAATPPARLSAGSSCAGRCGRSRMETSSAVPGGRLPAPPAPAAAGALHVGAHGREGGRSCGCEGAQLVLRRVAALELVDQDWLSGHLATIGAVTAFTTPFGREEIEQLIPHRDPFLFLDEIVELEPGARVVARLTIRGDEWFLRGHFPGRADHARRADGRGAGPGRRGRRAVAPRFPGPRSRSSRASTACASAASCGPATCSTSS